MSAPLRRLSTYHQRRLGIGWMATMAATLPPNQFASSVSSPEPSPLLSIKRLAYKLRDPGQARNLFPYGNEREESAPRSQLVIDLCSTYDSLPPLRVPLSETCERGKILKFLSSNCAPAKEPIAKILNNVVLKSEVHAPSVDAPSLNTITNLRNACTPAYEEILEYILRKDAKNGMRFLIRLREDLFRVTQWMQSEQTHDDSLAMLRVLDAFLLRLFSIWFSPGMLEVQRITYHDTAASVIEFIATKEAVHPMKSLNDLRSRLGPGRRVFGLFHPLLKNEPLLFVHAALTDEIPSSMEDVMDVVPSDAPKCATFYSITNAQAGLAGVGLGEYLLKQSTKLLQREFSSLGTFATLSPMPRFRKWLEEKLRSNEGQGRFFDGSFLSAEDRERLAGAGIADREDPWKDLLAFLETSDLSADAPDPQRMAAIQPVLTKLAARYLVLEKHRGKPLDRVARFHLGNGAGVHRINFGADPSRKGMQNSFGMMVNYRYDLDEVAKNQKKFEANYEISASPEVWKFLPAEAPPGTSRL